MGPENPEMYLIFAMTSSRPGEYLKMKVLGKIKLLDKPICKKLPTLMLLVLFDKLFQVFFSEIQRYSNCYKHTEQLYNFFFLLLVWIYRHNICPWKNKLCSEKLNKSWKNIYRVVYEP